MQTKNLKIIILNLPSPPNQRLWRDTAGGFGTAIISQHKHKRNQESPLHPFLPYASALLSKSAYEFKIIDGQALKLDRSQVLTEVKRENPDVIFSIISLPSFYQDLSILSKIKYLLQNVIVIGVGTVCSVMPNEILYRSAIDMVLRNNYPYTSRMLDLIQFLQQSRNLKNIGNLSFKKNGKIIHTPKKPEPNLGDLPFPEYGFIKLERYETISDIAGKSFAYVPILESKGCPYNCIYCPYPLGFGREIMFRPVKAIVEEMKYLRNTHNIKAFLLRGQTFAYNKKRAMEICEEIIQSKLDVIWFCESRVDEVSKELLTNMKRAGCIRIHYGVETGDPELLKIAKPGVRLQATEKAFKMTKEAGIMTQAHIILGWPNENRQTLERTRKLILKLNPDEINLNFLTPYPGTPLYEIAQRNNLLLTTDWTQYTSHTVVMLTKNLSADELYAYRNKIIREFAKQKLQQLFIKDRLFAFKKPKAFISKAKSLMDRILFPYN
jgi:radical SAM superfamily enzyme YgiQ (UPF0313 family)